MNVFYLSEDPVKSAQYHNDSHVLKMILEYAQLLSTAHRVHDGEEYYDIGKRGQKIKRWRLLDERENVLYKATHYNHPSAKWVRETVLHYDYVYTMFVALCDEFEYRWGKKHATGIKLRKALREHPRRIPLHAPTKQAPQAMDEAYLSEDSVKAYRQYYICGKSHLAKWTKREVPYWYEATGCMEKE